MKGLMGSLAVAVLLGMTLSGTVFAATLNVPSSYPYIQSAIDAAAWGDTVLVAPGEYIQSIRLKPGVTVQSSGGAEVTTIRGDGSWYLRSEYTYTVLGANNSAISGFTITGSQNGILNLNASPAITNDVITGNYVGIGNDGASPLIAHNVITGNYEGIGSGNGSSPVITNNIIIGNAWGIHGGGGSSTITNNTITLNSYGIAVMWHFEGPQATITNNIITGNDYGIYNIYASPTVAYNDIWNNRINISNEYDSFPSVSNNISLNPIFADPAAGDYHLQEGSPCIDAGTNNASGLPETDFDGNPRIADGNGDGVAVVDMGAFEGAVERRCFQAPEFEITSFGPDNLWPPTRKIEEVIVSGKAILPGGCTLFSASYSLSDEYGFYTSEGALPVDTDGNFTITLQVEAWRDGGDIDGRHYGISLFAEDDAGVGSKVLEVFVPHDQRR